jgi:hypothetical protein
MLETAPWQLGFESSVEASVLMVGALPHLAVFRWQHCWCEDAEPNRSK